MTSKTSSSDTRRTALSLSAQRRTVFLFELRQHLAFFCVFLVLMLANVFSVCSSLRISAVMERTMVPVSKLFANPEFYLAQKDSIEVIYYQFGLTFFDGFLVPIAGYLLALFQFRYLFNRRPLDVFGALPVTRGSLFSGKIEAGLFLLLLPLLLLKGLTFLANALLVGYSLPLLLDLGYALSISAVLLLLAYFLTVWVMVQVGTTLEAVLYPAMLTFVPLVLYSAVNIAFGSMIYGYIFDPLGICSYLFPSSITAASIYSPFYYPSISNRIANDLLYNDGSYQGAASFLALAKNDLLAIAVWAVVLVMLAVFAKRIFLRRPFEIARCRGAGKKLHHLFTGLLVTGVLLFGITLSGVVLPSRGGLLGVLGAIVYICATLLGAFVVYTVFTAVVYGRFVWQKRSLLAAFGPSAAFAILLLICGGTMGFGTYRHVPSVEEIASASISYTGIDDYYYRQEYDDFSEMADGPTLRGEDAISLVTNLQQALLDDYAQLGSEVYTAEEGDSLYSVSVTYLLKNGKKLEREYNFTSGDRYDDLLRFNENEEFRQQTHCAYTANWSSTDTVLLYDRTLSHSRVLDVDPAVLQDACITDLQNNFSIEELKHPSTAPMGYLYFTDEVNYDSFYYPIYPYDEYILSWIPEDELFFLGSSEPAIQKAYLIPMAKDSMEECLNYYSTTSAENLFYMAPNRRNTYFFDPKDSYGPALYAQEISVDEAEKLVMQGVASGQMRPGDRLLVLITEEENTLVLLLQQ